jgi:hypothetical protein
VAALTFHVAESMSANVGVAPTDAAQFALAAKVMPLVRSASPGPTPAAWHAACSAAVPDENATARGAPGVNELVVATSELDRDDVVEQLCASLGVPCVRGSEDDVLDRFHVAAQRFDAGVVVRMMADCPLIDPAVVGKLVALRAERGYGWAAVASGAAPTELGLRRFPHGLDAEIFTAQALESAWSESTDPADREHVTPLWAATSGSRAGTWRPTRTTAASAGPSTTRPTSSSCARSSLASAAAPATARSSRCWTGSRSCGGSTPSTRRRSGQHRVSPRELAGGRETMEGGSGVPQLARGVLRATGLERKLGERDAATGELVGHAHPAPQVDRVLEVPPGPGRVAPRAGDQSA